MNIKTEWLDYDVIVVGSGGAGAQAAYASAENGAKVLLVSKDPLGASDTKISEGLATVRESGSEDDPEDVLSENIKYGNRKKPQQSPININTKNVQECSTLCNLEINYKPSKCNINKYEDNLIRMVQDSGSYIKFGENNYELRFIFFHTPSNHIIDGKSASMEINFYHGIMEDMDIKRVEELRDRYKKIESVVVNPYGSFATNPIVDPVTSQPIGMSSTHNTPNQTRELAFDTIELNRKIESDGLNAYTFVPFHGVPLRKVSEDNNFVKKGKIVRSLMNLTMLDQPQFSKEEIEGIRRCFVLYVKMPRDRWDDIKKAESLTPEGDKIWLSLKNECSEKYMNFGDHDETEGVDMVDFEK